MRTDTILTPEQWLCIALNLVVFIGVVIAYAVGPKGR